MKKPLSLTLALSLLPLIAVAGINISERSLTTQERIVHRSVIIRLGPDGPYSHTNSIHAAVGFESLSVANNGCDITVNWNGTRGAEKIMAAIVDEDETVSSLGVQAGYSGNIDKGTIKLYKNTEQVCATDPMFTEYANLWVHVASVKVG